MNISGINRMSSDTVWSSARPFGFLPGPTVSLGVACECVTEFWLTEYGKGEVCDHFALSGLHGNAQGQLLSHK